MGAAATHGLISLDDARRRRTREGHSHRLAAPRAGNPGRRPPPRDQHLPRGGGARPVPGAFRVLASQNPREHAGTYPLPESQLDRFLLRLSVGYPAREVERELLLGGGTHTALTHLHPVASAQEVRRLQAAVPQVTAAPEIADYVLAIVAAPRNTPLITLGASPRG